MTDRVGKELDIGDWVYFYFLMDDTDYVGKIESFLNEYEEVVIKFNRTTVVRDAGEVKKMSESDVLLWMVENLS